MLYPYSYVEAVFVCGLIQFLAVSGLRVYGVILAGWSSNSKYSLLGSVRAIAQRISYEVPMTFTILSVIFTLKSFWCEEVKGFQAGGLFMFVFMGLASSCVWLICILAETNRAPFDFVEGESELVSGFNVEYGGGGFAIIFMAEYRAILFNSLFFVVLFLGGPDFFLGVLAIVVVLFFVWVRGTVPRIRYDKLMKLC